MGEVIESNSTLLSTLRVKKKKEKTRHVVTLSRSYVGAGAEATLLKKRQLNSRNVVVDK